MGSAKEVLQKKSGDSRAKFGLGYRPVYFNELFSEPETSPVSQVEWFEIVSENFLGEGGRPRHRLERLVEHGPVAMHGVSLSLGGSDPISPRLLKGLARLTNEFKPSYVSDHLCWTSYGGKNSHDLLPLRYGKRELERTVERIHLVQDVLQRRIYLENPSAYVALAGSTYLEPEFLAELVQRTGCGVLLDVNNLYVNQQNLSLDPYGYCDYFSEQDICYFHLAGHTQSDGVIIDTHDHPIIDPVWDLFRYVSAKFPNLPVLIERDDRFPPLAELLQELNRAREISAANNNSAATSAKLIAPPHSAAEPEDFQATFMDLTTGHLDCCAEDDARLEVLQNDRPTTRLRGMRAYNYAYTARLIEVARNILPAFAKLVKGEDFEDLIKDYIRVHPSNDPRVDYSCQHLADFIRGGAEGRNFGVPAAIVADLVAFEWAQEKLYGAPDASLSGSDLQTISESDWEFVTFVPSGRVQLFTACYDVKTLWETLLAEQPPRRPEMVDCHFLIFRDGFDVAIDSVTAEQHFAMERILAGRPFGEICAARAAQGVELPNAATAVLNALIHLANRRALKTFQVVSGKSEVLGTPIPS